MHEREQVDLGSPRPAADTSKNDVALVLRMAGGDASALGAFYDRWSRPVQHVVSAIVRSSADTEEVVEEAFWQAWNQSSRFEPGRGSVSSWILTIARSRAMDRAKAQRRRREDVVGSIGEEIVSERPGPADDALASEQRSMVALALRDLPDAQREAVEMAYFGGLSQSEIAECTGHPLGTIKTRLRLAMQKLRDRLAPLSEAAR